MSLLKPEIYVVCTTTRHRGRDHGKWIKANQKPSSLKRAVRRLIISSPVPTEWEDWEIHLAKDFGVVKIGEYDDLETISKIARFIAKEGELGAALVNYFSNVDEAKLALQEYYYGAYDSEEDFAIQHLNKRANLDKLTSQYMDYKRFTRDIFIFDFFALEIQGKTHVFSN